MRKAKHRIRVYWNPVIVRRMAAAIFLLVFLPGILFISPLQDTTITSRSMQGTLEIGEKVVATQAVGKLKRGDIILFDRKDILPDAYVMKRIVGMPGDEIKVAPDGSVFLNGSPLEEKYALLGTKENGGTNLLGIFKVPDGSYFVMGDNRPASYDSRYWDDPYVKKSQVVSKALFVLSPKFRRLA